MEQKTSETRRQMGWLVYLLECSDGTYYCGVTNNLEKRITAHNAKKGAKYTKTRLPVRLLVSSKEMAKSDAFKLEYKVKQLPRSKKIPFLSDY